MAERSAAFIRFMDRTLAPADAFEERIARAIEDYADSDLLWLLRGAMLDEGVKPFSKADNILAHLRERIERREGQEGGHA